MSRKVYISTGASRKTVQMYLGVDNVARKIKCAYVGVSGSSKKFWPIHYKWARYNVSTETRYTESRGSTVQFYTATIWGGFPYMPLAYSSYSFNSTTGQFSFSGNVPIRYNDGTAMYNLYCSYNGNHHLSRVECNTSWSSTGQTSRKVTYYGEAMNANPYNITVQGSFIDYVYSETRTTYPDNAQSGSYWYVYQGEA